MTDLRDQADILGARERAEEGPAVTRGPSARPAILIVDHGSRQAEANELVVAIAARVRVLLQPEFHVEYAHMEIADPDFFEGVAACVRAGAREIVVQPYFLGEGRHTRETIPGLIEEAARHHPGIAFRVSAHLGLHEKLVEVVLERIRDVLDT